MKTKITMLLFFAMCTHICYAPNLLPSLYIIEVAPVLRPDNILLAHMDYESNMNPSAYNEKEDAAGILQIRPIMVLEVNNILRSLKKDLRYTLADRFNKTKSIEMWYIIQKHHNPSYNPLLAARMWNGGTTKQIDKDDSYYQQIKTRL